MIKMTARNLKPVESEATENEPEPGTDLISLGDAAFKTTTKGGLPVYEGMRKLILYMPAKYAPVVEGADEVEVLIRIKH